MTITAANHRIGALLFAIVLCIASCEVCPAADLITDANGKVIFADRPALGSGVCTLPTTPPTPFVCDYWTWPNDYQMPGAVITGWWNGLPTVNQPYGLTQATPFAPALFLLHVWGDDGSPDIPGPVNGDTITLHSEQIIGCGALRTKDPLIWRNRGSDSVRVIYPGDFDEDLDIDWEDMMRLFGVAFMNMPDTGVYDLDGNCDIDITDAVMMARIVARHIMSWGQIHYGCTGGE